MILIFLGPIVSILINIFALKLLTRYILIIILISIDLLISDFLDKRRSIFIYFIIEYLALLISFIIEKLFIILTLV